MFSTMSTPFLTAETDYRRQQLTKAWTASSAPRRRRSGEPGSGARHGRSRLAVAR